MLTPTVHLAVLNGSQTVDGFVFVEQKSLAHLADVAAFLLQQHLALRRQECQVSLCILLYRQFTALPGVPVFSDNNLFGLGNHHQALRRCSLHHMHDAGGKELHLRILCPTDHDGQ